MCVVNVVKISQCEFNLVLHLVSSHYLTLGYTLSSVSSPPAESQTPQCRHNVEQSLVFLLVSGIWWRKTHIQHRKKQTKKTEIDYLKVASVRFLSRIRTCWLPPCCQTAPEGWTARSTQWRRKPGDSAFGGSSHAVKRKDTVCLTMTNLQWELCADGALIRLMRWAQNDFQLAAQKILKLMFLSR